MNAPRSSSTHAAPASSKVAHQQSQQQISALPSKVSRASSGKGATTVVPVGVNEKDGDGVHGTTAGAPQQHQTSMMNLQLLVYVDKDQYPQKVSMTASSFQDVVKHLQHIVSGQPIGAISLWDDDFQQYVPIRSIEAFRSTGGKGKVWVETSGCKVRQLSEEADALEFAALREHVDKLSRPKEGAMYKLQSAHKLSVSHVEEAFKAKRRHMVEPGARTQMLFYTNNARPSDQVVQHGFALPPGGGGSGIVFASDIDAQPSLNTNIKFLLCEVAVGKPLTVHQNLGEKVPFGGAFDTAKYDSLMHISQRPSGVSRLEEWVIYDPDQAVPRYIVTCSVVKATGKMSWEAAALGCQTHPGEAMKLWCVTCRQLMCPYCMTVGAHRGHDGRDVAEVAMFERQVVVKMSNTLDNTIARRQEEIAELERIRALVGTTAKKGEESIRRTIDDLHQLLMNVEQQLLIVLDGKKSTIIKGIEKDSRLVTKLFMRRAITSPFFTSNRLNASMH